MGDSPLPDNVLLSRRAVEDLDRIPDAQARILVEDIGRLARKTFPGDVKKIKNLPGEPWQADSGRFRILHRWNASRLEVISVFPKSQQKSVFHGLR